MTKNFIIAVLAIGMAMSLIFGIYQQTEAKRQEALAVANAAEATTQRDIAEASRREAEEQRKIAIMNAIEAERQRAAADEALEKCMKKK